MRGRYVWVIVLWMMALTGCHQTNSTRPTDSVQDSAVIAEVFAYQRLAIQAENDVIATVKADTCSWVQHEFGWWYRYTHKSDEHEEFVSLAPVKEVNCPIRETVYTLDGSRLIVDAIRMFDSPEVTPARNGEEPFAYRLMLRELVPDDTVIMLIPWTLAYGQSGSLHVPPYTSIRVQLTLQTDNEHDAEYDNI